MASGYNMDDASGWFSSPVDQGNAAYSNNPYETPVSGKEWSTVNDYDYNSAYGYDNTAPAYTGNMTPSMPQQNMYSGNMFMPNEQLAAQTAATSDVSFEDEPPLLEELGINFSHIRVKTVAVLNPVKETTAEVIQDQDLAGPLVFCLLFGAALLFHGKVHFGFIYGIGVVGSVGMYALLNLMSLEGVSFTCTVSVLGYCLLPMALLSALGVVLSFKGVVGMCLAVLAVMWCTVSSSKLFVTALGMDHQRFLVAYPCMLVYGMFALLAVF